MSSSHSGQAAEALGKLETLLEEYLLKKAPAMPENAKDTIVSFAPYIAIIEAVLSASALLTILGLGALVGPFTAFLGAGYMMSYSATFVIGAVGLGFSAILNVMAFSGLMKKEMKAWRLMYNATLISSAASLLQGTVGGALVSLVIGMYILFQVREKYR